jgi:hypothetical protein
MKISVELDREQATALLTVLRRIDPSEIAMLHESVEWAAFDKANEAGGAAGRGRARLAREPIDSSKP